MLFAWDSDGNFVGSLKTGKVFDKTTSNFLVISEFDCTLYSTYTYKTAMRMNPADASITADDGVHCYFYRFTDDSLAISGKAADAKAVGDELDSAMAALDAFGNNFAYAKSINLFDKENAVLGYYVKNSGVVSASTNMFYELIPIEGPGVYSFYGDYTIFGKSYVTRIHVYDSEKSRIEYITGTHFGSEESGNWYGVSFTITQTQIDNGYAYFAISQNKVNIDRLMVVKDIEYPEEYVPYYSYKHLNEIRIEQDNIFGTTGNPLPGKTALFFGDSICDGVTAQDNKDGWAGRIVPKNEMAWFNYGTSGGTFVEISGRTNIVRTIDTAINDFPNADYIVFEGWTNDADLNAITLGTYDPNDYGGTYDTTTFSGAFETAIYKILTYWRTAHVGYIVAQKMGRIQTSLDERYSFFVRAMEICKKWGIQYLNLWDGSILNPAMPTQYDSSKSSSENIEAGNMYTDGQHLTPAGYEYLTPIIEHWMRGL